MLTLFISDFLIVTILEPSPLISRWNLDLTERGDFSKSYEFVSYEVHVQSGFWTQKTWTTYTHLFSQRPLNVVFGLDTWINIFNHQLLIDGHFCNSKVVINERFIPHNWISNFLLRPLAQIISSHLADCTCIICTTFFLSRCILGMAQECSWLLGNSWKWTWDWKCLL